MSYCPTCGSNLGETPGVFNLCRCHGRDAQCGPFGVRVLDPPKPPKAWRGLRVVADYAYQLYAGTVIEETDREVLMKLDEKYCGHRTFWFKKDRLRKIWP
jgi:hypothetical protein